MKGSQRYVGVLARRKLKAQRKKGDCIGVKPSLTVLQGGDLSRGFIALFKREVGWAQDEGEIEQVDLRKFRASNHHHE